MKPSSSIPKNRILTQVKTASKAWRELNREQNVPADRWLARFFNENRKMIGSRDRKFISEVIYSGLRNKLFYDYWLQRSAQGDLRDPVKSAKFLMLLAAAKEGLIADSEIFEEFWDDIKDRSEVSKPKALFEAMTQHRIVQDIDEISVEGEMSLKYSFPLWLVKRWNEYWGNSECEELLKALNERTPFVVRFNRLKTTRDKLLRAFEDAEMEAKPLDTSSVGIVLSEHKHLKNMEAFKKGHFEVQSEASQMVGAEIGAQPGEMIWDVCAGGGGKSLLMAAEMKNKGEIVATDIRAYKLKDLKIRAKRAGAKNIKLADVNLYYRGEVENQLFDKIVVDAPCSGTGTISRAPDLKWKLEENSFSEYAQKQIEILRKVWPFLKPYGELFYITCSIDLEENEGTVEKFLEEFPDAELRSCGGEEEFLRIMPHQKNTDGFFMAKIKKMSEV